MNHQALVRPSLPGTTPAAGQKGQSSVYATRAPPHFEAGSPPRHKSPPRVGFEEASPMMASSVRCGEGNGHEVGNQMVAPIPGHTYNKPLTQLRTTQEKLSQRQMQQKVMTKIVSKLPYQLRESVSAVLTMAFAASENIQKDLDVCHQEVMALRDELIKRSHEVNTMRKACVNYQEQLQGLQENVESLKDNVEARQKFIIKNRSAMTRLAATNRMLIDALDALQDSINPAAAGGQRLLMSQHSQSLPSDNNNSYQQDAMPLPPTKGGLGITQLAPLAIPSPGRAKSPDNNRVRTPQEYHEKVQIQTMSQNDKLRESLLKIAREHYRSMKLAEHQQEKLTELSNSLRLQEAANRTLRQELTELRNTHHRSSSSVGSIASLMNNGDASPPHATTPVTPSGMPAAAKSNEEGGGVGGGTATKSKTRVLPRSRPTFGQLDAKLMKLLESEDGLDPSEGLLTLRRILAHLAIAPNSLSLREMIVHIVERDAALMFESDMLCLFLRQPGSDSRIHKFSCRSREPQSLDIAEGTDGARSLAALTMRTGRANRLNLLTKSTTYHNAIDGCVGIVTRRLMAVPLHHQQSGAVLGAMIFINKGGEANNAWSEADELFAMLFAQLASLLLTSCVLYDAIFYHSQLLRALLESSTDLYSVLPDPNSLAHARGLNAAEVLYAMQRTACEVLKATMARAFIITPYTEDSLVFLDPLANRALHKTPHKIGTVLINKGRGLIGAALRSKELILAERVALDIRFDPSCDLDPLAASEMMLTVPILDLKGQVLGALQLVAGQSSPRLKQSANDPHDFRLSFAQAASWLAHQLSPPLEFLLQTLGRPAVRPASTPSKMTRNSIDGGYRASFVASSDEAMTQALLAANQAVNGGSPTANSSSFFQATQQPENFESLSLAQLAIFHSNNSSHKQTNGSIATSGKVRFESNEDLDINSPKTRQSQPSPAMMVDPVAHEATLLQLERAEEQAHELQEELRISASKQVEITDQLTETKQKLAWQEQRATDLAAVLDEESTARVAAQQRLTTLEAELAAMKQRQQEMEQSQMQSKDEALIAALRRADAAEQQAKEQQTQQQTTLQQLQQQLVQQQAQTKEQEIAFANERKLLLEKSQADAKAAKEALQLAVQQAREQAAAQQQAAQQQANEQQANEQLQQRITLLEKHLASEQQSKQDAIDQAQREQNSAVSTAKASAAASEEKVVAAQVEIEKLQATLRDKERVQAALQEQVVKLANQKLDALGTAYAQVLHSGNEPVTASATSGETIVDQHAATAPAGHQEAATASAAAVSEWQKLEDESGNEYYYNTRTGETSWHDPSHATEAAGSAFTPFNTVLGGVVGLADDDDNAAHGGYEKGVTESGREKRGPWLRHEDDSQQVYWVHETNGQAVWVIPPRSANDDDDDDSGGGHAARKDPPGIFDTQGSQFSATAGDYTIEL